MKPATSLFDLFQKAKTDRRYRDLVVMAYTEYTSSGCKSFGLAKSWVNKWVKRCVESGNHQTCERMVNYINDLIPRIEPQTPQPENPPVTDG
jgi:hypothetical protein